MAFDAAATVQAPMQGAAASARSAARQDDASDPFGALLAMLDGARTDAAPTASPRPLADVSADEGSQADSPVPTEPGKDAPTDEAKAPSEAVSDPATLVAAMMAPTAGTPAPVAGAPAAEAPAAPTAPPTAAEAVVPVLDLAPSAVAVDADAAPETEAAPVTPAVQTAAAAAAEVAPPVQQLAPTQPAEPAQAAAPAAAPAPVPAPVAVPDPAAPALAEAAPVAAPPRLAANDKPSDPTRAEASATEADIATAPRAAAGEQGRPFDGGGADGRPSDAEASQQTRNDNTAVPAAELATFAAAADGAPEAPAPAVGVAQAAAPAPVIAAQAAVTPVRGAPETVAHLAAQMIQRLDGQTTRFDLTLNPQSLGRVDVRIEIGAKGALRARMAFDDAATAQEMSGRHTELRAALQSAGFDVPEGALSFDVASGGGGAFAERRDTDRVPTPVFQNLADTADQIPAAAVKNYFSAAGSSGVDIRV